MKTARLVIGTLLLAGLALVGVGCLNFSYELELGDMSDNESYVEFRMDTEGMDYGSNGLLVDGEEYEGGKIEFGQNLHYYIEDVDGFLEEDGLFFPYMNQAILDSDENVIALEDDVFGDISLDGTDLEDAEYIYAEVTVDDNFESGEVYTWYVVLIDAKNENNSITSVIEFEVE